MRGLLVTFEGGDGAGKSTLIDGLHRFLSEKGETVLQTRAPGGTDLGDKIRRLLLEGSTGMNPRSELFLFLADRAEHVERVIIPALKQGKIILCDRFNDSTLAYQGVARGLDSTMVRSFCDFAAAGVVPDLTLYLDIDPVLGLERSEKKSGVKDRMESEALSFHQKIRDAFRTEAKLEPQRIRQMDGSLSPHTLLQQAIDIIYAVFPSFR